MALARLRPMCSVSRRRTSGRSLTTSQAVTIDLPISSGRSGLRYSPSLRLAVCSRPIISVSSSRSSHSHSCCSVSAMRSALTWFSTSRSSTSVRLCHVEPSLLLNFDGLDSRRRNSRSTPSSRCSLKVIT